MIVQLPTSRLASVWSPYRARLWNSRPVRIRAVGEAIARKQFQPKPWSPRWRIAEHTQRIAWLVVHGWSDPIEVDVGVPGYMDCLPHDLVTDGNHRLAAAIYRKDLTILASVSGSTEYALELFGVEI